ncbi:MAG: 2'-5' RNA ligase family protein, partial [Sphaerochaeta sp.]|nr:2'-5' RNA ligase family protein [Sphaerochaeta sp.]
MGMVDFNPAVHREGVQLYEIRSVDLENGLTGTTVEESKTPWEQASKTPWYYLVDETDPALTATKQHDEAIIVLRPENPEEAARLALPNGIPPADLHVTLADLGPAASTTPEQRTEIEDVVRSLAVDDDPVRVSVQFNGVVYFVGQENGATAFALNADSPDLETLRGEVVARLAERGLEIVRTHGFTPHMTLAYVDEGGPEPTITLPQNPIPLVLELWWGDERPEVKSTTIHDGITTFVKSKVDALREALGLKASGWRVQPFHDSFGLADEGSEWSFEAADGNAILDKGGWALYKKVHLACDTAEGSTPEIKSAYKYPVAKLVNGKPTYFFRAAAAVNSGLGGGARRADIPADVEKKVAVTLRKIYEAFERDPEQVSGSKEQVAAEVAARLSKIKVDPPASQGYAFKTLDGNTWWLQFTTNNFIDREGEIFSRKALEDFIARHAGEAVKGEFWYRHVPGTKFGNVTWQALVGNFLVQAGPFDDTPVGRAFKEFLTTNPSGHPQVAPHGWGTSHGYYYKPADKAAGVYEWLEIKESTVLPVDVAANVWSPMPLLVQPKPKEYEMNTREEKELRAIGGDALVQLVKEQAEGRTEALKQGGVANKSLDDVSAMLQALADSTEDQVIKDQVAVILEALEAEKAAVEAEIAEITPEPEPEPEMETEVTETLPEGFAEFSGQLDAQMKELRDQMSIVAGAVKTLAGIVTELKRDDTEKIAEKATATPAASLR